MKKDNRKYRSSDKSKRRRTSGKKAAIDLLKILCWFLIPVMIAALLVLDALGIYIFSTERLLVLGIGLLVVLLPFFSEITLKNLTVKRNKT